MIDKVSSNKKRSILSDQRILLAIVIIGIMIVVSIINPKFIDINNIVAIFQQISVLGILTMSMSLLLISGGIDLSIGNMMGLICVVIATVLETTANMGLALLGGLAVGVICGLINGVIVAKSKCIPLIITLGTSQVFYGIALFVTDGSFMSFDGVFDPLRKIQLFDVIPLMVLIMVAVVVFAWVLLNRTKFGRRIVAIGGNEKNAYLSGINVDFNKIMVYTISGIIVFVGAIVFAARLNSVASNSGNGYELNALTAAIIGGITFEGGKGTIVGAFLGCLFMGIIQNAMNILQVDSYIQIIITGIIIVVAVVLSNLSNIRKK